MLEKRVTQAQTDFYAIKASFGRAEEASRTARHSNEMLQEEYCKLVHTVNDERKRNRMLIDDALLKVQTDLEIF